MRPALLLAFALCATLVLAALPPFDFTGTWTGAATSRGQSVVMMATFTSTGPTTFTGSVTLVSVVTCQVNGKYARRVKLHLMCDGGRRTLRAHLDPRTATLSGFFHLSGRRVRYMLTKNGA